jgi:hypothetical protein
MGEWISRKKRKKIRGNSSSPRITHKGEVLNSLVSRERNFCNIMGKNTNYGDKPWSIFIIDSGNFPHWGYDARADDCGYNSQGI